MREFSVSSYMNFIGIFFLFYSNFYYSTSIILYINRTLMGIYTLLNLIHSYQKLYLVYLTRKIIYYYILLRLMLCRFNVRYHVNLTFLYFRARFNVCCGDNPLDSMVVASKCKCCGRDRVDQIVCRYIKCLNR